MEVSIVGPDGGDAIQLGPIGMRIWRTAIPPTTVWGSARSRCRRILTDRAWTATPATTRASGAPHTLFNQNGPLGAPQHPPVRRPARVRPWRPGMPLSPAATCALSPSAVSRSLTWSAVLQAGWAAPSASNRQHRDFVLCTDRARIGGAGTGMARGGPRGHLSGHGSGGGPRARGISGTTNSTSSTWARPSWPWPSPPPTKASAAATHRLATKTRHGPFLGVPSDQYCAYLLALGYPADRPLAPLHHLNRRPFDQVVHRGHW